VRESWIWQPKGVLKKKNTEEEKRDGPSWLTQTKRAQTGSGAAKRKKGKRIRTLSSPTTGSQLSYGKRDEQSGHIRRRGKSASERKRGTARRFSNLRRGSLDRGLQAVALLS